METRTIYFNRKKGWGQILIGIALMFGVNLVVPELTWLIPTFIIGGSFIFFGLKSVSGKPQLILSDEGLYIGFKFNKTISWNNIEKVCVKKKEVDYHSLHFLELIIRVKSFGPSNVMKREFLIENLDTKPEEIEKLIRERL